ncbi:hypothetical protein EDC94DRAFT_486990, partial [Helicostylum pulchrum]
SSSSRTTRVLEELQESLDMIQKEIKTTIMQILESKQQLLDTTKKSYVTTENRVKQLKDEAMNARKELDDLKRREHAIEKECDTIQVLKEKQVQQKAAVEKSVVQLKAEFDKELAALTDELANVKLEIETLKQKDITELVKERVEKQAKERQVLVQEFNKVQEEIQVNNQEFIKHVKEELEEL